MNRFANSMISRSRLSSVLCASSFPRRLADIPIIFVCITNRVSVRMESTWFVDVVSKFALSTITNTLRDLHILDDK
ncbi:hypothetical protein PENTCL1PPCAC_8264 [Pristionchus entomophagus]|uniref:Uncharacterized protein n=1 Tax=Pristionchus entomophagus TaxID=358040 RepID=A0AAV5STA0_9BILA|nr:hypothetical protein PENTCL1PPCAC_8264 [Pristionchus entomophagus]